MCVLLALKFTAVQEIINIFNYENKFLSIIKILQFFPFS